MHVQPVVGLRRCLCVSMCVCRHSESVCVSVYICIWSCGVFYVYLLICLSIWLDLRVMIWTLLFINCTSKIGPHNLRTKKIYLRLHLKSSPIPRESRRPGNPGAEGCFITLMLHLLFLSDPRRRLATVLRSVPPVATG